MIQKIGGSEHFENKGKKKEGKAAKPEEGTGALNSVMGIKWRKKRVGPAPLHPRPRENGVNRKKGQPRISLLQ